MAITRKPDAIYLIAVYYGVLAVLCLLGSCLLLTALAAVVSVVEHPIGQIVGSIALGRLAFLALAFLIGSTIAAWGLFALKGWGRSAAIVMAVLHLPIFPVFTIIGGLLIYYLLRPEVAKAFRS